MATTRLYAPRPYDSIDFGIAGVAPILPTGTDVDNTKVAAVQAASAAAGYGTLSTSAGGTAPTPFAAPLRDRGPWQANTVYSYGDVVTQAGSVYVAPISFTSGSSFVASNWTKLGLYDATDPSLSATYAPLAAGRPGNLAVFLGDSETLGSDDPVNQARGDCWPVYLSYMSGAQVQYVKNAGIFGNKSADMLARFDTDVTPSAPNVVTLMAGTNDTGNGVSLATFQANMTAMVAKIRAIGAVPVLFTMPPNNGTSPTNRKQQVVLFNAWIRRYAAQQGIALVDAYAIVTDPTNGSYLSAYNSDGTHWNAAGMVAVAQAALTALQNILPPHAPVLCQDDNDENNLILDGCFTPYSGTALPTNWNDGAGTPAGSAISYTTDAAVPGKLLTVTSTATAALRQLTFAHNVGTTTMPATSAGATSFSISVNPFQKGILFIGSGATYEIAKVASVSGAGPYTVTLTRALVNAHAAGEQVVVNAAPGDTMAYCGKVTTDGGVTLSIGQSFSPSGGVKAASSLTRAITRGVWYQEYVVPVGTTQLTSYLQVGAGTGVTSFAQVSLYNLTRMAV